MNKIEKTLNDLGLTENEIKVYLASLSLGQTTASILGQKTGINRSTSQYVCGNLVEKKLLNITQKANSFLYAPEKPEKLLSIINNEYTKLEKKMQNTHEIMGFLKNISNPHAKLPKVKYYTGFDGLVDLLDNIFTTEFDCLYGAIEYMEDIPKEVNKYIEEVYMPKREKLKIESKIIVNDNKNTLKYFKNISYNKNITLFVDEKKYPFSGSMQIFGNKIAFYSYSNNDMTGILIENEYIKNIIFSMFKLAWERSVELPINEKYKNIKL